MSQAIALEKVELAPAFFFTLPLVTLTNNQVRKMHFAAYKAWRDRAAWEIKLALVGRLPRQPLARARVRIERMTAGTQPDDDNLKGGLKPLIDCLVAPGAPYLDPKRGKWTSRHPSGLALILDDSPSCMTLDAVAIRIARKSDARTTVTIWDET